MEIKDELLDIDGIKNSNKALLELFIRRTAVVTSTQERVVEKIVKDQWKQANKATQTGSPISEIDFCNLGTLYISPSKARKRIERIKKMSIGLDNLPEDASEKTMTRRKDHKRRNTEMIDHINFKLSKVKP